MLARLLATLLIGTVAIGLGQDTTRTPPRTRTGNPATEESDGVVSRIQVGPISHSSVTVRFHTAIPGGNTSARVDYGPTPELGFETLPLGGGSGTETARSHVISGLRPATRYYFRPVVSDDKRKFDASWTCPSIGNFPGYVCERRGSLPYFITAPAPETVPAPPELPAAVDTAMPVINGQTFTVTVDGSNHCSDFQEQLNAAAAADTSLNHQVMIPAGATCYGRYVLPKKIGTGVVVVRTSTPDNQLPPPGVRIDPSYRSRMAKLSTPPVAASLGQDVRPALRTAGCSSGICTEGWRIVGIEITHPRHDEIPPTVRKIVGIEGDVVTLDQPHGLDHFNQVHIAGVQGMSGANGTWQVGVLSPTSVRIRGAHTSGTYSGGGYLVHALSSAISDCSNTSPIVCTTATPHGLSDWTSRPIESINAAAVILTPGHGLQRNQAVEIRDSSSAAHNGVWAIDQVAGNRVTLRDGPRQPCNANCGTITPRATVEIGGVEGNTAANGSHLFHVLSPTQIELPGTSGNGSYTSGGFLSFNPDIVFIMVELGPRTERIILDRCYIHGQGFPTRVLIAVNVGSSNSAVIDSYFDEINYWGPVNPLSGAIEPGGRGSTTFNVSNGKRLKISNNAILNSPGVPFFVQEFRDGPEMTPTDISITRNLFFNSDRLRSGSAESDGRRYVSSHLMEFKKGRRILIDGNIFDGCWADRTPTGPAVAFSPRGARGVTDNQISDVTVTNNVFRRVSHAVYVIGNDSNRDFSTNISSRFKIGNNLFAEINYWKMHSEPAQSTGLTLAEGTGSGGAALWILGPVEDLEFTHNTVLDQRGTNPKFVNYNFGRSSGVVIRYNIFPHNEDGSRGGLTEAWAMDWAVPAIKGSARDAFEQYFVHAPGPDPTSVFSDNVVIPGVRGTFRDENFDDSSAKVNFTKADCEEFYKGFSNITCAGGKTAHQRFQAIFGSLESFQPAMALPGNPGVDVQRLEQALGMTVREALQASEKLAAADSTGAARFTEPPLEGAVAALAGSPLARPERAAAACEGAGCLAADPTQLETLLARSQCGDRIVLAAGETVAISQPIRLGPVDCPADNPLVITTSAESQLPAAGGRITPSHAALLARLEATGFSGTVFISEPGSPARGVVLRGLELSDGATRQGGPLLRLEGAADIVIDQCYLHTHASPGGPAAVLAGERIQVVNSYLEGYCPLPSGPDTATVAAGGAGPVTFRNNYIAAAAIALSANAGAEIEFRHNTVERPASHNPCRPEWDGVYRSLGALVAMAAESRGIFEFNLFEDSWAGNLKYPAAVSMDASSSVVFRGNTFRGVARGFGIASAGRGGIATEAAKAGGASLVSEGNFVDSPVSNSGDGVCGAQIEATLFEPGSAAGAFWADGASLDCGAESNPPGSPLALIVGMAAHTPEEPHTRPACSGIPTPNQILHLAVRAEGGTAVFHYEVSDSAVSIPCVAELRPSGASTGSIAVADNQSGRQRSAAAHVEPGLSYEYRLMCGGDMQRGTFHAAGTELTATAALGGANTQR